MYATARKPSYFKLEDEVVAIKGLTDENRTYRNNLRKGHLISG
jgi:hypothetical protein